MGWFLLNYIWTDFCLIMYLSQKWVGFPSRNVRADFYHIMYLSQKFDDFRHIRNVLMYQMYLVSTTLARLAGHQHQKKISKNLDKISVVSPSFMGCRHCVTMPHGAQRCVSVPQGLSVVPPCLKGLSVVPPCLMGSQRCVTIP